MPDFARHSDRLALAVVVWAGLGAAAAAEPPERVVSINLCTDQLAMLIAAPDQLVSVTWLARDPSLSAMADEARDYPTNRGRAEEIFLLRPDLVLADIWSSPETVSMLRRLGIPVAQFPPGESMDTIRSNILRMGELLGREERAGALAAGFDARLAALRAREGPRPLAATYAANGYAAGAGSLTGQIVEAAGFDNVATAHGIGYGGTLPLEALVMAGPDLVILGQDNPGSSRAEAVLLHPALRHLPTDATLGDAAWTCGTPFVLDAVADLVALREAMGTR